MWICVTLCAIVWNRCSHWITEFNCKVCTCKFGIKSPESLKGHLFVQWCHHIERISCKHLKHFTAFFCWLLFLTLEEMVSLYPLNTELCLLYVTPAWTRDCCRDLDCWELKYIQTNDNSHAAVWSALRKQTVFYGKNSRIWHMTYASAITHHWSATVRF